MNNIKETNNNYQNEKIIDDNVMQIDIKNIDAYFDLIDEACMLLYEKTNKDYLSCFKRVYNDIINDTIDSSKLDDEDVKKLKEIEDKITKSYYLNEEIRQALLLNLIKGFKHINGNLDLITPDFIGFIYTFIIKHMFENDKKPVKISIMDVNLGTGNLLNLISNNLNFETELIGIEKDNNYCHIAQAFSDLQGNEIQILNASCLESIDTPCNVIIGDLDCENQDRLGLDSECDYLPYNIILKYQTSTIDKSYMIFMVDNNFFAQKDINKFKEKFKGTIMGLIVLPQELFKNNTKSILIISPKKYKNYDTMVVNLPSPKEDEKLKKAMYGISNWIKIITNGGNK